MHLISKTNEKGNLMQLSYVITSVSTLADDNEDEHDMYATVDAGTDELRAIINDAVRKYGIVPQPNPTLLGNFWGSNYPDENREYFEEGRETYYLLSFPGLSVRNRARINDLIIAARR